MIGPHIPRCPFSWTSPCHCAALLRLRSRPSSFASQALLIVLAACSSPPVNYAEPEETETPWCFAVTLRFDGVPRAAVACGETSRMCEQARSNAIRYRRFARVTVVGECTFNGGY